MKHKTKKGAWDDEVETLLSKDNLALSFLDVLSCGLGGAVCLFLIFSVMPHIGQAGGQARSTGNFVGNEAGRPVGAKFVDLKDQVQNSVISLSVKVRGPANALAKAVEFRNLPRQTVFSERGANNLIEWFAFNDNGVSPTRKIEIWARKAQFPIGNTFCQISVAVGGFTQFTNFPVTRVAGSEPVKLLSINLLNAGNWFEP